jgi:thiosulfate reductase cytochrome b subunit
MKSQNKKWSELSLWEKIAIFNYWSIVYLLMDLTLITGCLILLVIRRESMMAADIWIGFGCFFAWCSLPSFVH